MTSRSGSSDLAEPAELEPAAARALHALLADAATCRGWLDAPGEPLHRTRGDLGWNAPG